MRNDVAEHYDLLIEEGNDPVLDPPNLQNYMDKWDGKLFIDLLELNKTKRVLEIGCGTGRIAVKVAPFVKSFCGIDISPMTIEIAKEHLPFANTKLICADFLTYEISDSFDLIYSSLTFMHIKNKKRAIEAVDKALLPGGRFVLSIDKSQKTTLDFGNRKLEVYPDTPSSMISLLKANGFSEIKQYATELAYILTANKPSD